MLQWQSLLVLLKMAVFLWELIDYQLSSNRRICLTQYWAPFLLLEVQLLIHLRLLLNILRSWLRHLRSWLRQLRSWLRQLRSWIRQLRSWLRQLRSWLRQLRSWLRQLRSWPPSTQIVAPSPQIVAPSPQIVAPSTLTGAPSPRIVAPLTQIMAPSARIVAPSVQFVAPSPRIMAPSIQIVAPPPCIMAPSHQIVASSARVVVPSLQIVAPPPQILAPSEKPQIRTLSEALLPLPDILSDVDSFNLHLLFPEQSSEVDDWMNGKGGIPLPHLETSLPLLPPSTASIKTLTSLLKVKQSLLAAAVNILPVEYQNYREEEDQVAAIRKMIAERFASNPAYQLLKARFLSCFTLPALLATINPSVKCELPTDNNGDEDEVLVLQKIKKRIWPPAAVSWV